MPLRKSVQRRQYRLPDAPQGPAPGMAGRFLARPGRLSGTVRLAAGLGPIDGRRDTGGAHGRPLASGPLQNRDPIRLRKAGRTMKLDDILQGNDAFVFMERYVDEAAKTYSPFAGQTESAPEY